MLNKSEENIIMSTEEFWENVREVFKPTLKEFKNRISKDYNFIKIGFITDTHYSIRDNGYFSGRDAKIAGMAVRNRSHLYNLGYCSDILDFCVHGGDVVDGNEKTDYVYNQLIRDMGNLFSLYGCPKATVMGNHDNNTNMATVNVGSQRLKGYNFAVSNAFFEKYFLDDERIIVGPKNCWFYDIKGIHIIGLND